MVALALCLASHSVEARKPNIIYILADDLGYGDLGCYGQKTLTTPNLDRMAAEGMRFTRHYSGSTVCAPSRCVLMTGLHTGHARIRGNGPGQLLPSDVTFARLLQQNGYATGCFGKWGIGNPPPLNDPAVHGFDEFYGYLNMYHAHNFYPEYVVKNGLKIPLQNKLYPDWYQKRFGPRDGAGVAEKAVDYLPQMIADETLKFIRANAEKPFFIYYALNIPHANNEGGGEPRINRDGMRVPDWGEFKDQDWPAQEKGFAQMMHYIDRDIGNMIKLLKELGVDDDTVIMFSSDNGPHQEGGHKMAFFDSNGPLKGMKRDLYEGGIRVPFIVRWPGKVPAGQTSAHISGFQDIFPTVCELAGIETPHRIDGISFAPTLLQEGKQKEHRHLYWEFYERGGKAAVVKGDWKAVRLNILKDPDAQIELYDLSKDIGEESNIASRHPALVEEMARIMKREHVDP
ncbi:MAG: N-acetylgalactosamine-6-sulfatase [Verrucomicrobiales bacterium]|nr:N-acetylgalactosamine-6-sulfatase [Verrucomicrobiales bacterium]